MRRQGTLHLPHRLRLGGPKDQQAGGGNTPQSDSRPLRYEAQGHAGVQPGRQDRQKDLRSGWDWRMVRANDS